jgi:hypothetical protein
LGIKYIFCQFPYYRYPGVDDFRVDDFTGGNEVIKLGGKEMNGGAGKAETNGFSKFMNPLSLKDIKAIARSSGKTNSHY